MGWFDDQRRRDEAIREARRQSNEEAVQSAFIRGFKPQLELVKGRGALGGKPVADDTRGVFQDTETFPGVAVFTVVDSAGSLRLRAELMESDVEDRFIERLEKWLDQHDPVATLQVI